VVNSGGRIGFLLHTD